LCFSIWLALTPLNLVSPRRSLAVLFVLITIGFEATGATEKICFFTSDTPACRLQQKRPTKLAGLFQGGTEFYADRR
jgi:hypothetical protein